MLGKILEKTKDYLSPADRHQIAQVHAFAEMAHGEQKRLSGEPYMVHPVEVALILAELKQDADTICAALLHDVLEDTKTPDEEIKRTFGAKILFLVKGVTKLTELKISSSRATPKEEMHAENTRKMFLAMAKDIRIVFIKLADRLHNMRTLEYLPRAKQIENARETMDIFAPLAHRLGLGLIKWELEDLSFRYLDPDNFWMVREKVTEKRRERESYIKDFIEKVKGILKEHNIHGEVSGRAKHFYSIFRKMQTQHLEFEQIYDLSAVRALVDTQHDCYGLLGLIHARWKPIPGKIKDYIAMPKENNYRSLHTTVIGPEGKQVEIQIRTFEMHSQAEYGIASHWLYKQIDKTRTGRQKLKQKDLSYIGKMTWLRKLAEDKSDNSEFLDTLKTDMIFDEVYVSTPKGDIYSLCQGATPVDFAYQVHTEIGNRCIGAKVNNKIVPLESELHNGDVVEILTSKTARPNSDWLSFAQSPRTKTKIKSWIAKQNKQQHLNAGREMLEAALQEFLLEPALVGNEKYLAPILKRYAFHTLDDLYTAIGHGDVASRAVARTFWENYKEKHKQAEEPKPILEKPRKSNSAGVVVDGVDTVLIRLANCCHPLPGDAITGFVTMGYGITVHRASCKNVSRLKERKIAVFWHNTPQHTYPAALEVAGFDRVGIFKDILNVIADTAINVQEATARKTGRGEFKSRIIVDVRDLNQLLHLLGSLKKIKDVYDAYRLSA
ncbi:MAG: bifunctional (p)ppGpp synthetase/guanosine-3',5'-bis(diphosphate) 3'-pyrophosphohydrolase [Candidatus Margulisbacteria bacterium]|jgi:GTP pyrophosphokinase|nr:bifunctional (p)ppGpp synthetase/guanosine-3',5'-bis(diphosphate) 3'-pyrophosphohydrolase [Candidatus Margulisiibacteriota bacterium]